MRSSFKSPKSQSLTSFRVCVCVQHCIKELLYMPAYMQLLSKREREYTLTYQRLHKPAGCRQSRTAEQPSSHTAYEPRPTWRTDLTPVGAMYTQLKHTIIYKRTLCSFSSIQGISLKMEGEVSMNWMVWCYNTWRSISVLSHISYHTQVIQPKSTILHGQSARTADQWVISFNSLPDALQNTMGYPSKV